MIKVQKNLIRIKKIMINQRWKINSKKITLKVRKKID